MIASVILIHYPRFHSVPSTPHFIACGPVFPRHVGPSLRSLPPFPSVTRGVRHDEVKDEVRSVRAVHPRPARSPPRSPRSHFVRSPVPVTHSAPTWETAPSQPVPRPEGSPHALHSLSASLRLRLRSRSARSSLPSARRMEWGKGSGESRVMTWGTVGRQSHRFLSLDQPFTVHYAHSIPFLSLRVADRSVAFGGASLPSATRSRKERTRK